ncbi:uncharacterized protein LOC103388974 isoform X3 [Cynoglossus semilaevis]|uniref:uncharacterized protein LOC103388974 isoform X3 n=1 Tax=Cynoglossus semilaevis TaxID=244447 RepID=UPI0004972BC6|nr:uncharacterized protein LOC103388974 isoform X3 [Cynoglossus semilaevis]
MMEDPKQNLATGKFKIAENRTRKSAVWRHFDLVVNSENNQASGFVLCKKCGRLMKYDSKKTGNSPLQRHASKGCRMAAGRSKETCVPELPSKTASSLHISDSTIGLLPHKEDPDEGPFIADDEAEEGEEEQLMSMNCTRFQEPQATSKLYTLHLRKQIELTEATTRVKRKRLEELELDLEIKRKTLRKLELEIMKLERELCETR